MSNYFQSRDVWYVIKKSKRHRIRTHHGTPYITYKRATRILYQDKFGNAFINLKDKREYFQTPL